MKKLIILLITILVPSVLLNAQKLSVDDVVQKHMDAIGAKDQRVKAVNITVVGDVQFSVGPSSQFASTGRGVFASEGSKILFALTFSLPSYPLEKITWDGKKLSVGFPSQGVRSALGEFLATNEGIFKEGLLGGVLEKDWVLLDLAKRGGRLTVTGAKKIDGKDVIATTYEPKRGFGLTIKMYFDKDTFRHIRTEYFRTIAPPLGPTPEASAGQSENVQNLTEDFFDFKTENGLTLPRGYRLTLSLNSTNVFREYRYDLSLKDFYHNRDLDPATFTRDSN